MKKIFIPSLAALILAPSVAFAEFGGIKDMLVDVGDIIDMLTMIAVGIALLVFFWGVTRLIWGGGEAIAEGKTLMIWGVVALFVIMSVWGLVRFLQENLLPGADFSNPSTIPSFGDPL